MGRPDVVFVGCGLANGLSAYLLKKRKPDLNLAVIEESAPLGGSHTWSFHESDVSKEDFLWVSDLISKKWDAYEVNFPKLKRTLNTAYYSIQSQTFHEKVFPVLEKSLCFGRVKECYPNTVVLEDGRIIEGKYIIDGRGEFPKTYPMGYQKFLGQYLVLEKPHGLKYPILMDATCEQIGGFRFFYVLPWDQTKLLVEDTRYSTDKDLPENQMRQEIRNFCFKRGWQIAFVSQEEIGCLPIPLGGESPASNQLIKSGSSAGLFHATTGYSLGFAIKFASRLVCYLEKPPIVERIFQDSIGHWKRNRLFRLLNRMLFHKSPDRRYEILQRFYSLPKSLVGRFYAGELTGMDKLRIFWGMPPITFRKVLSSIFSPLGLNEYRV